MSLKMSIESTLDDLDVTDLQKKKFEGEEYEMTK
jgi:hypothetical protein